jgi:transketolase
MESRMTYQDTLLEACRADSRIVVLTAENRGAIRKLPDELGDRFIDVGIAEQTMIGMAAGLALRGRIPVAHALAAFLLMRAYEFIRTDVGIAGLPVKLVGAVPGLLSEANGATHQAVEDVALMRTIPGMQIVTPADEQELLAAMPLVIASPSPCYVRFNAQPPAVVHSTPFAMGKAETFGEGGDVAILTYGLLLGEAVGAARKLSAASIPTTVINLRTLVPLDTATIARAAGEARLLVTLEDHMVPGGLFSILSEALLTMSYRPRVLPLGLSSRWFRPGLLHDVIAAERLSAGAIAESITAALATDAPISPHYPTNGAPFAPQNAHARHR